MSEVVSRTEQDLAKYEREQPLKYRQARIGWGRFKTWGDYIHAAGQSINRQLEDES